MPALCIVLSRDKLENSDLFLVRLLKSFRRPRCIAEVARKANVFGKFESNEHISVSNLSLQQQEKLRCKTHSHSCYHNQCRCPHWPPHCSSILQSYPSVKGELLSGGSIVLINISVGRRRQTVQCDFDRFLCAMELLQTIVNVLRAVEQRKGISNFCCYYFIDPRREIDADWWFSLARLSKDWACFTRACSLCHAPHLLESFSVPLRCGPYILITSGANNLVSELHSIFITFTRKNIKRCCFRWSSNLTSYIFRFVCVGWLDTMMWHACNRRYMVGDRVLYEHVQEDGWFLCRLAPAVVSSVASDFLRLSLDIDNSIDGRFHVTVHGDFRRCKSMRRFVFDGDVVSFSEENTVVIGVVRRDEINSMVRPGAIVDDFQKVRVELMPYRDHVLRCVGDLHFCFKDPNESIASDFRKITPDFLCC